MRGRSSRPAVDAAASSRSASCGAARSSPASRGSTAGRSQCWASDPYFYGGGWTTDAAHKVTRFVDLAETFHLPVVHFVDIPGFVIGVAGENGRHHPARRARHGRGLSGARRRGARSCCASRSASPARRTRTGRSTISATPGRRATGARCRSKAASRPPTRPTSPRRPIRTAPSRQSRRAQQGALAVPHRRDASASRRSSTRATPASFCASSPTSPRRCASPARAASDIVR